MKKKFPVKRIILIVVALAVVGAVAYNFLKPAPEVILYQSTFSLSKMDLMNTVDVTGNVESDNSHKVHSTLTNPVMEIMVKEGDTVQEGDVLCLLDPKSTKNDIQAKQQAISSSQKSSTMSLEQAQTDLYYAEWYLEHNQDASILAAQSAVEAAERGVVNAEFSIRSAEQSLGEARKENREAKDDGDDPVHSETDLNRLRDAVSKAYLDMEAAEKSLEEAKQKLKRTQWDVEADLKVLRDNVTKARNNADLSTEYISLTQLQEDLEKCTITAPASGTVTAVYATEGATGNGLLFVVEDTGELVVDTRIKEFDVNTVKPGMKVQIKSDATGDEIYEGELLSVSPASQKNDQGSTITGSTAEYTAKVRVTSRDTGLRIGMNVRLNIITDREDQVMAVQYDSVAVGMGPEGQDVVYVAVPQEDGSYIAKMVVVETGMETDLYLEVTSPDLNEGDLILSDPLSVTDGMTVNLAPEGAGMYGGTGGMGMGRAAMVG